MGIRKEILLDDRLPCMSNKDPMFARPIDNELWVVLLEKGWCKLFG
jgi:hypothetical protein